MKRTLGVGIVAATGLTVALLWWWQRPADDRGRAWRVETIARVVGLRYPEVPGLSAAALRAHLADDDIVLVDVRTPEEQAVSMLPGAITVTQLEARLQDLGDRRVVAYCTIGLRSGRYARELRARGIDATNLEGSVLAWTHVGGPLDGPAGPTKRVHVNGERWHLVRSDYEAVW